MAELDIGFKLAAHSSAREMCRLRHIIPQVWEPIGDTLQTTERLADRAFRAEENGERFTVYFEAYSSWHPDDRWNVQAKSALLSEREHTPTLTLLFFLRPTGYTPMNGTFRQEARGSSTQQTWWEEICLWQEQPQPWWDQVPGLMALLPLCDHGRGDEESVTYAAQHILTAMDDTKERGDLLTTLGIFGKMRYPVLNAFDLIGRELMRESPFYQEILAEGRIEEKRLSILEVLEARLGSGASTEFREALEAITDVARLSELLRAASKCRSVGGFRRALRIG
jgi:hypothetical protein